MARSSATLIGAKLVSLERDSLPDDHFLIPGVVVCK